ncbi:CheR family methyltransferase [Persicimonas caeni]|nr:protein-glutamate O-methyltransferase CheR [Persicimonas caeni]
MSLTKARADQPFVERMDREFVFTDEDFAALRASIRRHAGISMSDAKRNLVYSRLARRLRELNLNRFADYRRYLEATPDEVEHFVNALTTNRTDFFREAHHFDHLTELLQAKVKPGKRFRIWSAACSTGEEPYTIAMTVRESLSARQAERVEIVASDIDTNALSRGVEGVYALRAAERAGEDRLARWFLRGSGPFEGKVRVKQELRDMISFGSMNLLEPWSWDEPFDAIFCRNVAIYFDKETQTRLFSHLGEALVPNGHLYIGHSESLFALAHTFEHQGKTIYRKRGGSNDQR